MLSLFEMQLKASLRAAVGDQSINAFAANPTRFQHCSLLLRAAGTHGGPPLSAASTSGVAEPAAAEAASSLSDTAAFLEAAASFSAVSVSGISAGTDSGLAAGLSAGLAAATGGRESADKRGTNSAAVGFRELLLRLDFSTCAHMHDLAFPSHIIYPSHTSLNSNTVLKLKHHLLSLPLYLCICRAEALRGYGIFRGSPAEAPCLLAGKACLDSQ